MINQLASSWYKDFNGFNKNILGQEKIMLPGDLIKQYDWNDLEKKNEQFINEMKPIEYTEAEIIQEEEGTSKKDLIRQRLRQMKTNNTH